MRPRCGFLGDEAGVRGTWSAEQPDNEGDEGSQVNDETREHNIEGGPGELDGGLGDAVVDCGAYLRPRGWQACTGQDDEAEKDAQQRDGDQDDGGGSDLGIVGAPDLFHQYLAVGDRASVA